MYTHKNNTATFLILIQFVVKHLIQSSAYISLGPNGIYVSFFLSYNHKCWQLLTPIMYQRDIWIFSFLLTKKSCKTGIILIFTNKHKVTGSQNLNQGLNIKSTHLLYKHLSVSYMPGTVLGTRDINSSFKELTALQQSQTNRQVYNTKLISNGMLVNIN